MVQVINNLPTAFSNAVAHIALYNQDGTLAAEHSEPVNAAPYRATNLAPLQVPDQIAAVHFLRLDLKDADGKLVSSNTYWLSQPWNPNDFPTSRRCRQSR